MKKTNKLLYIEWYDAVGGEDGWVSLTSVKKCEPALIKSCGIFLKETKKYVTLALSIDTQHDNVAGFIVIPKKWIKKIKELK